MKSFPVSFLYLKGNRNWIDTGKIWFFKILVRLICFGTGMQLDPVAFLVVRQGNRNWIDTGKLFIF